MGKTQTQWKPHLSLLNPDRIELLHSSAIKILETTGLNVHHDGLRKKLKAVGAKLGEDKRVFLDASMVDEAIGTARKNVVIYDRLGNPAMPFGPYKIYFGTGSDLLYTLDIDSQERRKSVVSDVGRSARLCDALDEIDFTMSFSLPCDVPNENAEPQQFYAILKNSTKPIIMTSFSGQETFERMHEMACVVAGGDQAFRKRPNYLLYSQFVSPLQHDEQAIERLIFCAEKEIPLIYIPTIMSSASGPITLAGSLALAVAEFQAGLVMHQCVNPGAPFICGGCVGNMDMRTMLFPYGSPDWRLSDLVLAELSRHYELPVFGTGGAADTKIVDAQAGMEYMSSLLVAAMAGTNIIHDVGYLESGLTGSLESIIMSADAIRWVKKFLRGIDFSEESLALSVIEEIGPAGQFLGHQHTLKHLRENMWLPLAFDHDVYDTWSDKGSKDYTTRARELAKELIASHQPEPMTPEMDAKLQELLKV
jgi:trimethylamine--corrinoid protein Co-methyltransferase